MTTLKHVADKYVEAYNKWQTLFAYYRLKGWDGQHAHQPAEVEQAYADYLELLDMLFLSVTGEPRPNFTERARRRILDERR